MPSAVAASEPAEADRAAARRAGSVVVTATVDPRERRTRIARDFLGLSIEYDDVFVKTGVPSTGVNPVFAGLLRNLTRRGAGPPLIRLGGRSGDLAWWNPERRPRPPGIELDLLPILLDALNGFSAETGARYILGLNFAADDPALAAELAQAARAGLRPGSIETFELGNEPENLGFRPHGRDAEGRQQTARPRGWGFEDYLANVRGFLPALTDLVPGIRLAAPVATCAPVWCQGLPLLLEQEREAVARGTLNAVAYHQYPLCRCPGERTPTIPLLLDNRSVLTWARAFAHIARQASDAGLPLRITETNSVAGGGARGVSDTFASTLWGLDWMFALAFVGADSVHFHSTSDLYSPFSFGYSERGFIGKVNPLYYAMLAFAAATADGARLLPEATFTTRSRSPVNVRLWGTVDRRGTVRVAVINKDLRSRAAVRITVPGTRAAGRLRRLHASRLDGRVVRFAGQRVPGRTRDGALRGRQRISRVRRRGREYRFALPRGSAAVLEVRRVR